LHTLTAVAYDNLGATATSAPVNVTMARYLPAIPTGSISIFLQPIATNMAAPDYAIGPPGDSTRLFVVEQNGLLRVIENGTLQPGAALDIQSRVSPPLDTGNPNDERGFLGLAFHPGYTNPASPGYRTLYTYNSELIPVATSPCGADYRHQQLQERHQRVEDIDNERECCGRYVGREVISLARLRAITMAGQRLRAMAMLAHWGTV
jgi:hypothetical protein